MAQPTKHDTTEILRRRRKRYPSREWCASTWVSGMEKKAPTQFVRPLGSLGDRAPSSKVLIKLLGAYVRGNFLRRKRNRVNQTNATKRIGTSVETTLDAELELWAEPMFGSPLWFVERS